MPLLSRASPSYLVVNYKGTVRKVALENMVQQLLDKRCVRVMTDAETGFYSRVYLVPKRSGCWRLVTDPSVLNDFLVQQTFEIDTLSKVKKAPRPWMWATSLDLSNAYHHIPMRQSARKFLCFQVGVVRYMYMVLCIDNSPVGVHRGRQTDEEVGESSRICALLIPRQFAQGSREQKDADWHDTRSVVTVSSTRFVSKRGQVRTHLVTVNNVSRRTAGFGHVHSLSDKGKRERDPHDHQQDPTGRRSVVCGSGVVIGISSIDGSDGLNLRPLQQQDILCVKKGSSACSADPHDGPISGHAQIVDVVRSTADRTLFPTPDPGANGLHRRIARVSGSGISGPFVARKRTKHHISWVELRAVLIAIQLLQFQLRGEKALLKLTRRVLLLADSLQITVITRHITD